MNSMVMMNFEMTYNSTLYKVLAIRNYTGNKIEPAALDLYKCIYTLTKSDTMYIYLYLRISHKKERDIRLPRHFKIILLSSLRHLKIYGSFHTDCTTKYFISIFVQDILECLNSLDYKTIYLLKILNQIIQKGDLAVGTYKLVLNKLYMLCYATPLAPVRNLAVTIINIMELKNASIQQVDFKPFLNISLITNFEDSRSRFDKISTECIVQDMEEYMKFIHKFFHFNVYNKAAGVVYRSIISRFNFNEFQEYIWPYWRGCLQKEIEKREFGQSLVKYWIPYTVDCYGIILFTFLCTKNLTKNFLVQTIYELRRKKYITMEKLCEGVIFENLLFCLENQNTLEKTIEIFCTFPVLNEKVSHRCFEIVEKYFFGNSDPSIHFEKNINRLLTHIFISEHANSVKPTYKFVYNNFVIKMSEYVLKNLKNGKNSCKSIKLCKNLIETMKKPSKNLKLLYDLPKSLAYGVEENRYFLYLENHGVIDLLTKKKFVTKQLVTIFNESIVDGTIIHLMVEEFNYFNIENLKANSKYSENTSISLLSLEKHRLRQKLILLKIYKDYPEVVYKKYLENLIDQMSHSLPTIKISDLSIVPIYQILKDLTVLLTGYEIKVCVEDTSSCSLGLGFLDFMIGAVEESLHEGLSIRTRKVVEYLFCNIIHLLRLLDNVRKKYVNQIFTKLIILIEKSNIRKLVTDALNLIMILSEEMEASKCYKIRKLKHNFFADLVESICNLNALQSSKMRKHPRMRALLHVICKGSGENQKQYVHEAISKMVIKLREDNLNPAVHTVILECLEILIAEPCFHPFIFTYAEEIIELSLTSFESKVWTVKNAAIQLTDALVSRFFGIQQTDTVRLRSFQEFCILFPNVTDHFFDILSRPTLGEKAIVILQYIAASEVLVYEHLEKKMMKKIKNFLLLFENLLISNESPVIKFIPHAFVSLCPEKDYSYYLPKISNFVMEYFDIKPSNIIVNHLLLFKEFIRKINDNCSLLKSMEINTEIPIVDTVFQLNDFLREKTAQYLDILNIRCFPLSQYYKTCNCDIKINVPMKKWYISNFIHNSCNSQISNQFAQVFCYLIDQKKFNFLLEMFLDHYLCFIIDKGDLEIISKISSLILNKLFLIRHSENMTQYKILIAAILEISTKFEDKIIFDAFIPEKIEDMNVYEAIAIQIIFSNRKTFNQKAFCVNSFSKITNLQNFGNFELDLLSKILLVVQKNLNSIDKYLFLKIVLYQILTNSEEENNAKLITRFGLECINVEKCADKLLTYNFLYNYFGEKEIVLKFLDGIMNLIVKFQKNLNICSFYLDTYNNLDEYKHIVEKLMEEIQYY